MKQSNTSLIMIIGFVFLVFGLLSSRNLAGTLFQNVSPPQLNERSEPTAVVPTLTPFETQRENAQPTSQPVAQATAVWNPQRQSYFSTNCGVSSAEVRVYVETSGVAQYSKDDGGNSTNYFPENMLDCRRETAWRTDYHGGDEWLRFTFSKPVRLAQFGIVPGYDKVDPYTGVDRWYQNRRITNARVDFYGADGSTCQQYWDYLSDNRSMQYMEITCYRDYGEVSAVVLTVTGSLAPAANDPRNFIVISDVDFNGWAYVQ